MRRRAGRVAAEVGEERIALGIDRRRSAPSGWAGGGADGAQGSALEDEGVAD